ncbi:MAG: vitamin B12-dependent ribonucleotide reductase [Spartobacteria bacterium]|nr:vitamin B12-dependent ribonucleotide reductase [Spartobacteria bacterium]
MLEAKDVLEIPAQDEAHQPRNPRGANKRRKPISNRLAPSRKGIAVSRVFSTEDVDPFDQVGWETRKATIADDKGNAIFVQDNVRIPKFWSMLATNVVASKYFYGENGTSEREYSVQQLIHRVARTITDWGLRDGIFKTPEDAEVFYNELAYLCLNQYGAFNSPVWFNCGLYHEYGVGVGNNMGNCYFDCAEEAVRQSATQYEYPQCSACFIQSVPDTIEGIMALARSEAMLFKFGSGTGSDLSSLRSSKEKLSGGGTPSGPLSFLKVYDSIAGVIKSGGKTRRAAKMNTLKCRHPDIKEFIQAKQKEEKKAWALIEEGYDGSFNGEAYASVAFQNENLSVRLTDEFMAAVIEDRDWQTYWITDPNTPGPCYKARDIMRWIAEGTWVCGDPGVQFEDTIQHWHTAKSSSPINSSNPCSEYMFIDNSACNLASLNLMKFLRDDGVFDTERFKAAVEIFITAQEIIVDNSSYPTEAIAENSHRFRPLGLGYANLGSLIMALGLPYDSDTGRAWAGAITAIMHFHAYTQSARLSEALGPFDGFEDNRDDMLKVIEQHRDALKNISDHCPEEMLKVAVNCSNAALKNGKQHGYRNAQVTVLAPTGTIGFMMDCDTTGVEPDIALVKYKALAGGGLLKIVNRTVRPALARLGYTADQVDAITRYIDEQDTIEGAPDLKDEHLPVFDCAFTPRNGKRYIPYMGHIKMMAAAQPFLSGAISKTVNMPNEATVEEIMQTYIEGWKLGLKALAIYRDGCKRSQPVNTGRTDKKVETKASTGGNGSKAKPLRKRMPSTRQSVTHKFDIAGHEGYLTVGLYDDGSPGELFITMAKEGSTIGGLMDSFGTAISLCLQYGVPLKTLVDKFAHSRFEPSGFTKNPDIPIAKSLTDYFFRWLGQTFPTDGNGHSVYPATIASALVDEEEASVSVPAAPKPALNERVDAQFEGFMEDAPVCDQCGAITVRNGACYRCYNCGNSMGCS